MEQIVIKGMSTSPSYEDGSTYSLVNIRHKQGALIPVPERKIVQKFDRKFDYLFIHQINDLERLIGVVIDGNKSSVYHIILDIFGNKSKLLTVIDDVIVGIEQSGYILSFIGKDNIYYARGNNKGNVVDYIFLGNIPELPEIEVVTHQATFRTVYFSKFGLGSGVTNENLFERAKATLYRIKETNTQSLFYDFFWVRFGYRLYDGSVVKATPPILVATPYYYERGLQVLHNGDLSLGIKTRARLGGFKARGYLHDESWNIDESWKDIIVSLDVFVSKPVGLSSIDVIDEKHKVEGVLVGNKDVIFTQNLAPRRNNGEAKKRCIDSSNFYLLRDLDVFSKTDLSKDDKQDLPELKTRSFFEFLDKVSTYERYERITFQEAMPGLGLDAHKLGANVSYSSNNRLHVADTKTTLFDGFNINRFSTRFSTRSDWPNRSPANENDVIYWDKDIHYQSISGSSIPEIIYEDLGYNGNKPMTSDNKLYNIPFKKEDIQHIVIKVDVETGLGIEPVYKVCQMSDMMFYDMLFLNATISYPDLRARRITVMYVLKNSQTVYEVLNASLESDSSMGVSYYFETVFKERPYNTTEEWLINFWSDKGVAPISKYNDLEIHKEKKDQLLEDIRNYNLHKVIIREPNKMKVSEVSNPMMFSNASTYQIGSGTILNMATNAMRVSEGQFGQYPLYVFTTKGIYAMNVGGAEAIYTSMHAPVSFDLPVSKHLCSTNNGVVFVSERGIKFITGGQQVTLLTSDLETSNIGMHLNFKNKLDDEVLIIDEKEDFLNILSEIDNLAFDPIENEIIISVKDFEYNYVINLTNGMIWLSSEKFHTVVKNSYPDLLVARDTVMISYKEKGEDQANVNIQLRPIKFGDGGVKQLSRLVLDGNIDLFGTCWLGVFSSLDNINMEQVRLAKAETGNYKDFDFGLMLGNKSIGYSFVFSGMMQDTTRIYKINATVYKEFDNDKMR